MNLLSLSPVYSRASGATATCRNRAVGNDLSNRGAIRKGTCKPLSSCWLIHSTNRNGIPILSLSYIYIIYIVIYIYIIHCYIYIIHINIEIDTDRDTDVDIDRYMIFITGAKTHLIIPTGCRSLGRIIKVDFLDFFLGSETHPLMQPVYP